MNYSVWVDFDDNGTFNSSEQVVAYTNSAGAYTVNTNFTVPTYAAPGSHKMRVRAEYYGYAVPSDPCGALQYGETEDYALVVNTSIPNDPTSITASTNTVCLGSSTILTCVDPVGTVEWTTGSCGGTIVSTGNSITVSPTSTTTYYARNYDNGQYSNGCATITITVNSAPVINCSSNISVNNDTNQCGAVVTFNTISTGLPTPTMTYSHTSGSLFAVGTTTVIATATNSCGVDTCSFDITVVDNIIPTVLTQNLTVYLDAAGQASITVPMIDNASFDNCGIASLVLDNMNFTCSNVGANTVTLTATDVNGNINSATATVTVVDAILPTVITQNVTIYLDAAGQASITVPMIDNVSFDNCGIATLVLDNMNFTCSNVGANTVTLTATDVNGNINSATATVTVVDAILPTVITQNVTIYLDAAGQASITVPMIDNVSFDNCGIATLVLDNMSFTCSNVGANTVILTATDVNGNVNSATAVITVVDAVAPIALCQPVTVTISGGTASITPQMVDNGSNDACGIQSLSVNPKTFDCSNIGANPVILTVTDNNGNVSTCQTTVTVNGVVPSCDINITLENNTYTGGDGQTIFLGYGPQSLTATVNPIGGGPFTYNWTGGNGFLSSTSSANPVFEPTTAGVYTLTCTVTNSYGCETTCDVSICVMDIRAGGNGNNAKVYLCHVPNGNINKAKTLSISVNAVPAHLGNHAGDKLGSCNQSCGSITARGIAFEEHSDSEHEAELNVYPNPSNESFNIILISHNEEEVSLSVYDVSGRLVSKHENFMPNDETNFGKELPTGVFFVKIIQGDFIKTIKVVKVQ
ncbi:MAG: T9SS type A sorting domain-containing protein [Saprospiraceae bacterium]|nr:T9SS type A sorting domain-containing protein [Saprospiraceae bacterium]